MSRMKIAVSLSTAARLTMLATLAAIQTGEDTELRKEKGVRAKQERRGRESAHRDLDACIQSTLPQR
jgi:hypothetical protein